MSNSLFTYHLTILCNTVLATDSLNTPQVYPYTCTHRVPKKSTGTVTHLVHRMCLSNLADKRTRQQGTGHVQSSLEPGSHVLGCHIQDLSSPPRSGTDHHRTFHGLSTKRGRHLSQSQIVFKQTVPSITTLVCFHTT